MQLPPVTDESLTVINTDLRHQLRDLFNFGIGLEQVTSEKLSLYFSFITNKSAAPPYIASDLAFTHYNIYHVAAGGKFSLFNFNITLGLSYGFGSSEVEENRIDVPDNVLVEDFKLERLNYDSIRLLFGLATSL
jgi:hypothetical protein